MKKNFFLLSTVVALFASCSNTLTDMMDDASLHEARLQKAKAFVAKQQFKIAVTPVSNQTLRQTFKVTPVELQSLLSSRQVTRTSTPTVSLIEPVVYQNDTIMYLVSFPKGWRLYSVDKRMPTVLAENYVETGKRAADILNNKAISFWISDIAGQTNYLKNTDEYDEQSEGLQQWAVQGRGIRRIPYQPVPGEYIYVGREAVSRTTYYTPHVTKTLWHGGEPFNAYCPTLSVDGTQRCNAGCVAVSVSQYLYFLQDKLGYSFSMPNLGSCLGSCREDYVQSFTRFKSWNLNELPLTDDVNLYSAEQFDKAALTIGYVGKQVSMKYRVDGSSAVYTDAAAFLNSIGVKGEFMDIGYGSIDNTLINLKHPVLARGVSERISGHMFLIDGAKYDLVEYEDVWRFLEDTTFYDPDRYGVILREKSGTQKENYGYQCNFGWNLGEAPYKSDADDTYYVISNLNGCTMQKKYFRRED